MTGVPGPQLEEVIARNEHPQTQDLDPLEGSSEKVHNKKLERVRFDNKRFQKNNPSTEEKVDSLISNIDENSKEQIKKKLIFGEVFKKELTMGFQTLKKKDRRQFSNIVVVKGRENFKKHKILLSTSSFTTSWFTSSRQYLVCVIFRHWILETFGSNFARCH
ncbi:hypothetical protein evm_013854 [Chilo suppressalis]|nr:hypothetical protein evm_013854 [Chilo suppressalis]